MSMNRVRFGLLWIFVLSLFVQLGALLLIANTMWPDDLLAIIIKLLGIYSIHLAIILAAIFAQSEPLPESMPVTAWTALILACVWNMLLLWRSISFSVAAQDSPAVLIKYLDSVSSGGSFLVVGAIAFFFGKGKQK